MPYMPAVKPLSSYLPNPQVAGHVLGLYGEVPVLYEGVAALSGQVERLPVKGDVVETANGRATAAADLAGAGPLGGHAGAGDSFKIIYTCFFNFSNMGGISALSL